MALRDFTKEAVQHEAPAVLFGTWAGLTPGDHGAKVRASRYSDKTMHVYGDFTGSGSISMRGSNKEDPDETTAADWFTLKDAFGNAATLGANGGMSLQENPKWLSPIVTGTIVSAAVGMALGTR